MGAPSTSAAMALAHLRMASPAAPATDAKADKARAAAQDFEAVFLNTLMQQMFGSVGNGPFGGGPAAAVWRSMLTDQYARTFAKAGGIGIGDQVYRSILAQQEVR